MKKFGLEAKVVISVILLALFISVIERYEMTTNITKQFIELEKSRNLLLLNTISPIISLNLSLGLLEANKEYLDEIVKQNSDILMLKIIDNADSTIYKYQKIDEKNIVKEQYENYFNHIIKDNMMNKRLARIELYVSDDRHKKILHNSTKTTIEIFFIAFILLIIFIIVLKKEFSHLKSLTNNILKYDPKKNNFPLSKSSRYDEVGIIHNAIISMVKNIHSYTHQLDELNSSLEIKVQERTKSLEDTNYQLNEYKNNLESKVQKALKEKEKANLLLAQQSKMAYLGEMLASIAHQWKQPLSVISAINIKLKIANQIQTISREKIDEETKAIENQLEFMTNTLKDFSDFFKPDKSMLEFSPYDAIKSIITLFGDEYKNLNITININQKTTDKNSTIMGYNNEYRQVMLNILNNAKDAIVQTNACNRGIDIMITYTNDSMKTSIQDYAGGIDSSVKDKLFEHYITTKPSDKGTGIGLYLSKLIIEDSMCGKLEVNNENGGALFTITLPFKIEKNNEI